jgi:hypothetical protein
VGLAYTAGLLHDIGRLGLLVAYPSQYAVMLRDAGKKPQALLKREAELFGVDHCGAGQDLVEEWGLPSVFGEITGRHHEKPSGKSSDWLRTSYLACQMADSLGFSVVKPCQAPEFDSLCKMLPPAMRHSFQLQAEVLKAAVGMGIDAHDSTVYSPPKPAVKGIERDEFPPEVLPKPATDAIEPEPVIPGSSAPAQTGLRRFAVAAALVFLVAASIAAFVLTRYFHFALTASLSARAAVGVGLAGAWFST